MFTVATYMRLHSIRARRIIMSALFHLVTQVRALVLEGAHRTGVALCAQEDAAKQRAKNTAM